MKKTLVLSVFAVILCSSLWAAGFSLSAGAGGFWEAFLPGIHQAALQVLVR